VSTNLATKLSEKFRIGFIDLDIYGPNAHLLLGLPEVPAVEQGEMLVPPKVNVNGREMQFMSMAMFLPEGVGLAIKAEFVLDIVKTIIQFTRWDCDLIVVDMPPGCLTADTLILTNRGAIPIAEVKPGDYVYSFSNGQLIQRKVKRVIPKGMARVYKLKAGGRVIEATSNHPFLKYHRRLYWCKLEDLKVGDRIITAGYIPEGNPLPLTNSKLKITQTTPDFVKLVGYYIGDGCIKVDKKTGPYGVLFYEGNKKKKEKYIEILQKLFDKEIYEEKTRTCYCFGILSKDVAQLFIDLGLMQTCKNKQVPPWVYNLPPDQRLAFIEGYCDADGYWKGGNTRPFRDFKANTRMVFESSNRRLIEQLHFLCCITGLHPGSIRERNRRSTFKDGREVTSTTYGFECSTKLSKRPYHISKIQKIEYIGVKEVFDLEIEETHNFVANGIIVHNSQDVVNYTLDLVAPRAQAILVTEPHRMSLSDCLRLYDILKLKEVELSAIVLNKYNLFKDAEAFEAEISRFGAPIVKLNWSEELQSGLQPDLFEELVEVVV